MTSVVKHLRSTTAGHAPSSLVSGQIAINEADGKVFWLDSDGTTIRSVTIKGLDTAVVGKLAAANNLSDVLNASTARTNLGLGSASTLASSAVAQTANNLSDLASAATARTNLGLGSAATLASSSVLQVSNNLSDVADPATARGNLGIAIGTNVQAYDADLGAIAAIAGTNGYLKKTAANTWSLDTSISIAANKTLTVNNSVTLAGTDGTTMTFPSSSSTVLTVGNTATITKGFTVTPASISTGSFTVTPANGNYQYVTNNGAYTITAPSSDCAVDILVTNGASAGATTFSGFTVGSQTGSALTTTNGNKFVISVRRINSVSCYSIYALQ